MTTTTFASRREMRRQAKPVLTRAVADNAAALGRATAGAAAAAGLVAGLGASAYASAPVDETGRESTSVQMAQSGQSAAQSPNIEPVSYTSSGSGIVSTAYQGIGSPYVWGGSTPGGWDCSGFVNWVYAQNGQNLPARTAAGLWAAGTTTSNPQPGDLVIEHGGGHVAVYIGNGQAIGAQNPSSGTVQYTIRPGNVNAYVTF